MPSHPPRHPDDYARQARQAHDALLQATAHQLRRAVERAVDDRRQRHPAAPLAVNLLPALRVRYGNLLNAQLLSAEIVLNNPDEMLDAGMSHPELALACRADISFVLAVADIDEGEPVPWDSHAPGQTLPRSLDSADLMDFVQALADVERVQESVLFSAHAQSLLISQAMSRQALDQLEWELESAQGKAAFYQAAFETVVQADKTPTLETVYKNLKGAYQLRSALGTGSQDATSYWLELGEIADEGSSHILGSLAQSEIENDVRTALQALPEAEQLVLWQEHEGIGGFFAGDYGSAAGARLSHDSDCTDEIVGKVCRWLMGSALDDWHNRAKESGP